MDLRDFRHSENVYNQVHEGVSAAGVKTSGCEVDLSRNRFADQEFQVTADGIAEVPRRAGR